MRSANISAVGKSWLGALLGLLIVTQPLAAMTVQFKPPQRGIPGRREGGGTRDASACVQGNIRLTALLPETNLGLTTAEYPRFFWVIPKTRAKLVEFSLFETDENLTDRTLVYKTSFAINGNPGVASLTLPGRAMLPPLAVGRDYRWSVAIVCNPENRQRDVKVDGWVQRIAPDASLNSQLAKANSADRVRLYANSGIWFDTLTSLADLRCARPKDTTLAKSWSELMRSVKLGAIAEQPFTQQCSK